MSSLGILVNKRRAEFIADSSPRYKLSGAVAEAANGDKRQEKRKVNVMNEQGDLQINIERFGRGPDAIDEARRASLEHPSVRERLRGKRNRLLSVQLV